jgi:serine protease Do
MGTGFIVRSDGYVVTNHHVIDGARQIFVRLFDRREYRAEIVGADPLTDIAVLRIEETGLPVASFGDSRQLRVGEWVLAIGNPLGAALTFTVTAGIASATSRPLQAPSEEHRLALEFIQTDAVANRGNSGGLLIDLHGRIVGMNVAIFSRNDGYQGYTLAIPANLVTPVAAQLIQHGRLERAALGVRVYDATLEDAVVVGLESVHGAVVQDAGSGAQSGLRAGDVIVAVDGYPVIHSARLHQQVWFKSPGDTVRVSVRREGGDRLVVAVPLVPLAYDVRRAVPDSAGGETDRPPPCSDNPMGVCVAEIEGENVPRVVADAAEMGLFVRSVYNVGPSFGKLFAGTDIITHVDGRRVHSLEDLDTILLNRESGDIVAVRVYRFRSGERGFARVRLR